MKTNVMVEIDGTGVQEILKRLQRKGFDYDAEYGQIPMRGRNSVIIRGTVDNKRIPDLRKVAGAQRVWDVPKMEPFEPSHGHGL